MKDDACLNSVKKRVFNFNSYRKFLLDDFSKENGFATLASALSFTNAPAIDEWVRGLKGDNFYNYVQTSPFKGGKQPSINFIQELQYTPKYYIEDFEELYVFFSKKESPSYDLIQDEYSKSLYYIFEKNFFSKIDNKLFINLRDYAKVGNAEIFKKKIKENIFIKLTPYKGFTKYSIVQEYIFPRLSIEVNGIDIFPSSNLSDPRGFLLLPGASFGYFFMESNTFILNKEGNAIAEMKPKNDEPVVYYDKELDHYILTNSYEKLPAYNKYIYIVLELYYHYFRVFEKWLIDTLG